MGTINCNNFNIKNYLFYYYQFFYTFSAQVLSSTVFVVLKRWGGQELTESSQFCFLMDSFFDCFNSRSIKEAERKRKPFLSPYE